MSALDEHVAQRISAQMRRDGFADCTAAHVHEVWETGTLDGAEALGSRILQEFDEYGLRP